MATANIQSDAGDDFVTCGVCFNEYHEETKKPKSLPCSHTICLSCLREIFEDGSISCPFCRNVSNYASLELVETLPTNFSALHILKLNKEMTKFEFEQCWCFTCGFKAQADCPASKHDLLTVKPDTVKNLDGFINLRKEFYTIKNEENENLTTTIQKISEIQVHLDFYSKAVKAAEQEILELQYKNDLLKAETLSKLDSLEILQQVTRKNSPNDMTEFFLTEVASHNSNHSNAEEMVAKMKDQWKKSLEISDATLTNVTAIASEYERRKRMRIAVKIFDENNRPIPTCPLLQNGFTLLTEDKSDPLVFQNMAYLSHAAISLMRKKPETESPVDFAGFENNEDDENDEEEYFNLEDMSDLDLAQCIVVTVPMNHPQQTIHNTDTSSRNDFPQTD